MTGGNYNLGTTLANLIGFDLADSESAFIILAHGQLPASTAAAMIVVTIGVHFDDIAARCVQYIAQGLNKPPLRTKLQGS